MKKMLFIKFSLCALLAISSYAQNSKTFSESFTVNKDAEVILTADYAEISIETWNKNQVEVEATVTVETEDEKLAEKILSNFQFEALGNSSKVEIRAGRKKDAFAAFHDGMHFSPLEEIEILTHDIKGIKIPDLPNISEMNFDFDFDMEKFNEEGKAYIIKFQDEIKKIVNDSTLQNEIKELKLMIEKEFKDHMVGDSIHVFTYGLKNKPHEDVQAFSFPKDAFQKKLKPAVKKKIIIKMPKDAKLKLDVKQSQLKVASVFQIDANLKYSGLQIDDLRNKLSSIEATHSDVRIQKANGLNLNLKYAKNIQIVEVNELTSTSKTSNLTVGLIRDKALIEGSFGHLHIKEISPNFQLVDIHLSNSTANVKLPAVNYTFYINAKASEINVADVLDYKVNTAFDTAIYQNKNTGNTSKVLNIKADYCNFELTN